VRSYRRGSCLGSVVLPRLPASVMTTCLAKLDRLVWSEGLSFTAHGVHVGVRVTDPTVMPDVLNVLPTGWKRRRSPRVDHLASLVVGDREPKRGIRRLHVVYSGAVRAFRSTDLAETLLFLEYHLEEFVAQMAPQRIFVHAGVVGWKGRAILIPGSSHSGKTSLVAALLRAGATYYSDEFAVLDERGHVHPYPRALRIRETDDLGRRTTAAELGARCGSAPLPVGLIVHTRYEAGRGWRPRRLSRGEGVLELLAHTLTARFRPAQTLSVLKQVAMRAAVLKGQRGEAGDVVPALLEAVA
jgi:hypothetical protein